MNGSTSIADSRIEVEGWLRASLPDAWVACVDSGRSPGSASRYCDFDEEAWLAEMFSRRYLMASWPVEYGGLGWSREMALAGFDALSRYEVPLPLYVTSLLLAGHGLLQHGTAEQRYRFLPEMASASEVWCQLFSEPEAGSDLASLRTRAERDTDGWVVTGQKVWSTWAHFARWGLLLARTGTAESRHRGITCFVVDMDAPGIEVRPLRQLTGDASFNEVFMDQVPVDDAMRLGDVNDGWNVARSVLQAERGELGQRRVGGADIHRLIDRHRGEADPEARQRLAARYAQERILGWMAWRGYGRGLEAQAVKLLRAEANMALQSLAVNLEGQRAGAHDEAEAETAEIVYGFLRSRANSIAGGTSEIMRNVIGEQLLGLPREPRPATGGSGLDR
jgi:alkylation response protein AidB-like acyl-CoA dehydrogenase